MAVRDHGIRKQPPRVRWLLAVMTSFTLGFVAAATLFAYTSRIPVPIKLVPTRGADDLLQRQGSNKVVGTDLGYDDRLQERVIGTAKPEQAPVQVPEPNLPQDVEDDGVASNQQVVPRVAAQVELVTFVQVGAFAESSAAERLQGELTEAGLQASVRLANDESLHRVLVGPFEQDSEAESFRAQMALQGRATQLMRLAP